MGVEPTDHVLEIGCAIGQDTAALAGIVTQGRLYAVDVWREGVEFTKSRIISTQHVELLCLNADDVPLEPHSLDKIVCFDTLHALTDPAQAVMKWTEWLKPGGIVLYKDPGIPANDVSAYAAGLLTHAGRIRGVDVFSLNS